jgi:hypothetical protein
MMFDDVIPRRTLSPGFRCALFGIAMTVLARLGPWSWPGWPARTTLDFLLARYAPSVVGPVAKGVGLVVLLVVNVSFWSVVAWLVVGAGSLVLRGVIRKRT